MLNLVHTKVPIRPYFGDDDDNNDETVIQSTHGRPPFTLPATLPTTRIFSHFPTRTQPEVKKPYLSGPAHSPFPTVPFYEGASLRRNSSCWISALQSMMSQKFPGIKHSVGKHIQSYEGSHVELSQSAIHWQPTSLSSTSISYMNVFLTLYVFSICDKRGKKQPNH